MLHPSFRLIAPLAIIATVTAVPAVAKDKAPPPLPTQIQELYACRDIGDAAARLACFDREVGELSAADQAKEITFTDRETAKKTRRGLFGFSFPKLGGIFGGDEDEISAEQAQEILREAPGVMLVDKREDGGYVTPVECVGEYATYVSRVREDPTVDSGLSLWVVSDNLRKGAALNAVQIAELLGRRHLQKAA